MLWVVDWVGLFGSREVLVIEKNKYVLISNNLFGW